MTLTIAEAAERTGLSADTLRYCERDGLMLQRVARSATGHRQYSERDLTWITPAARSTARSASTTTCWAGGLTWSALQRLEWVA